jgi:hypothetical protein
MGFYGDRPMKDSSPRQARWSRSVSILLVHDDFRVIAAAFPAPSGPANAAFAGFMGQFEAMIIAPQYIKMI